MGGMDEEKVELINEVRLHRQSMQHFLSTSEKIIWCIICQCCLTFIPQVEGLKSTIHDMEKERDFYFGKLRSIELICQEKEDEGDPTLLRIMDILYATDVSRTSAIWLAVKPSSTRLVKVT